MTSPSRKLSRNRSKAAEKYRQAQAERLDPNTGLPRPRKQTYKSLPKRHRI